MDRYERAQQLIQSADTTIDGDAAGRLASRATAHAVLALIDIITGDRETEIEELQSELAGRKAQLAARERRIEELLEQLDGCNDTLRRHEQAAANEKAATNNDLRKSYE